jgi:2,4-dienoyl-CoA reductase-like NADH-dependent reductase (Old Yellow Enzyme family)/thioredoxin reductase
VGSDSLAKLFQPIKVGQMSIRNRVVMPAMGTCFATEDGFVTEPQVSYYARRAEGGVGLVIVETTCIDNPTGRTIPFQLCIDDDKYISALNKLADRVQSHGAKIAIQLHHAGPSTHFEGGARKVAPSPVPLKHTPQDVPRELSKIEIREIVEKFAQGARRAREAGFDAVELLCAHGYLLNRFLSPHANLRDDEYGDTREGRVRIVREIVERIGEIAGSDFPVMCKVPGDDYVEGGIIPDESVDICKMLEQAGVSLLTVTGGSSEGRISQFGIGCSEAWQIHLSEKVKQHVTIPVTGMGKIKSVQVAEAILAEGKADLVAMGRSLIADPDIVAKAKRNDVNRIIPCIACNHCLDRIGFGGQPLRCSVNPMVGREYSYRITHVCRPRKVLVIGGGPAGALAAVTAASRGHNVVLLEQKDQLGGQLSIASIPPDKGDIAPFVDYLTRELEEVKVDVRVNTKATREVVEGFGPQVVIVASGALPFVPAIPGIDLPHVITAWDAFLDAEKVGGSSVAVIGGGMVGCEVGRYLASKGKRVTIVEQLQEVGLDIGPAVRQHEIESLKLMGISVVTGAQAKVITDHGIAVDVNGVSREISGETIILAMGSKPANEIVNVLATAKVEVVAIGDCVVPRRIIHAVAQGFSAGCYV